MKYLKNLENPAVVISVKDALAADYITTNEWELATKEEYEATFKKKQVEKTGGKNAPV